MKDLKISKELIKNVLAEETENLSEDFSFDIDEDYIVFRDEGETLFDYNIYKFAFKCKEWAYKNFKIMLISHYTGQCYINGDLSPLILNWWNNTKSYQIESDTEVGAIIQACNWVLKQERF